MVFHTPAKAYRNYNDIQEPENARNEIHIFTSKIIRVHIKVILDMHSVNTVLLPFCKAGKYGYINLKGEIVIPPVYDDAIEFENGLARVEINGAFGYIDCNSEMIIKPTFELGLSYSCGCIPVKENGKWGTIDKRGKVIITPQYDDMQYSGFVDGICIVTVNGKAGVITTRGEYVIPPKFQDILHAGHGMLTFQEDDLYGYMDVNGKVIVNPIYQYIFPFKSNISIVITQDGKRAFIDATGKILFNRYFDDAYGFSEGIACVEIDKRFFFIDESGNEVLSVEMDAVTTFTEGKAPILRNGKWGFINRCGKIIIPCEYDDAGGFEFGMALVANTQRQHAVIAENNKLILPFFDYYGVIIGKYDLIEVENNGEYGYMCPNGHWLYKPAGIP